MSKVFPDKKFGLWKREGMENLSDNKEEEDDENEKNENGKSVNDATVVCVPKWPEWMHLSVFLSSKPNFEHSSTLFAHTLSFYLHSDQT